MRTGRKIGEWSPKHPGSVTERVVARPRAPRVVTFALDAEGRPRIVAPDHKSRAARRAS